MSSNLALSLRHGEIDSSPFRRFGTQALPGVPKTTARFAVRSSRPGRHCEPWILGHTASASAVELQGRRSFLSTGPYFPARSHTW